MKILILANFGMGLCKFRKEILMELLKQGHKVIVSFPQDEYVSKIESLGCTYIETKLERRGTNPIRDIQLLLTYIRIIKSEEPDIVLTYTIKPNIYGGVACQLTNTPYISNITGLGTSIEKKGVLSKLSLFLYKVGLRKSQKIFFQNKENMQQLERRKIVTKNTFLLPGSGVNLEYFKQHKYPSESEKIKLLYIGRLMEAKGTKELFKAATNIKKKYKEVEFHIVGFSEEDFLLDIEKLEKFGILFFHEQQDDIQQFLEDCHAVIQPSHHEGMSNVLLEASAFGRPVIASNIPGCIETFDEGITGFGFEVRNSKSLEDTIEYFINLPHDVKERMGIAARKKMEKEFDRQIVVNEYMNTIKNIVGEI